MLVRLIPSSFSVAASDRRGGRALEVAEGGAGSRGDANRGHRVIRDGGLQREWAVSGASSVGPAEEPARPSQRSLALPQGSPRRQAGQRREEARPSSLKIVTVMFRRCEFQ